MVLCYQRESSDASSRSSRGDRGSHEKKRWRVKSKDASFRPVQLVVSTAASSMKSSFSLFTPRRKRQQRCPRKAWRTQQRGGGSSGVLADRRRSAATGRAAAELDAGRRHCFSLALSICCRSLFSFSPAYVLTNKTRLNC